MAQELRAFPRSAITQADLEMVIGLEDQISNLMHMRDIQMDRILEQMLSGLPVEPGAWNARIVRKTTSREHSIRLRIHLL
jgi:hypothetical protein